MSTFGDFFVWLHINPLVSKYPLLMFADLVWKLCFWFAPMFLYLRYIENVDPITYLKLNSRIGRGIFWGLVISLVAFVLIMCNKYLILHLPFRTNNLTPDVLLNQVVLVGLMEEIPFRGLVFQKLQELVGFWWGAILDGLVFVELHIAYWISLGKPLSYLLSGALSIFVFTLVSCALLRLTRSLWSSIIFHSIYDFISLFFG